MKLQLRAWQLLASSVVPPIWAATNWHEYLHVADGVSAASYIALLVSPALFILGARRLFDNLEPDSSLDASLNSNPEE